MADRIVDLTFPIHEGMTTYPSPWHPVVAITQLGRHGIEDRESRKVVLGTHTGTHMDAPRHFIPDGGTVDRIALDLLVGAARLVDFSRARPTQEIGIDDFRRELGRERPCRLVMRFDWSRHWGEMKYYHEQPFISEAAAQWLIDRGVRLLAMDTAQADNPDNCRNSPKDAPVHKIMLGQGCYFVECLTNLRRLRKKHFKLIVLPLKILGADGAPARCIAIDN
jgi:arylformamidase